MLLNDLNGLGQIEVTTIPMPDSVTVLTAAYTYSGSVLVTCRRKRIRNGEPLLLYTGGDE